MAKILVLGGRGFVGKAICKQLKKHKVFTCDRHRDGKSHEYGDVSSYDSLVKAFRKKDIVINLVGLSPLRNPGKGAYHKVHVEGVKNVIAACKTAKVKRLIHMSVLGADPIGETEFLRTRGKGERLVEKSRLNYTIIRPSIIFDKENELVQMASSSAFTCVFPNIPAKIQPVYRGDVAKIYSLVINNKIRGKRIELGGPQRMSVYEFVKKIYAKRGFPCLALPLIMIKPGIYIASKLGILGIGHDQIKSLDINNVTTSRTLNRYIKPTKFDDWLNKVKL